MSTTTCDESPKLIELDTNNWPTILWWEIVGWCGETFGNDTFGVEWYCNEDHKLFMREDRFLLFALKWLSQ